MNDVQFGEMFSGVGAPHDNGAVASRRVAVFYRDSGRISAVAADRGIVEVGDLADRARRVTPADVVAAVAAARLIADSAAIAAVAAAVADADGSFVATVSTGSPDETAALVEVFERRRTFFAGWRRTGRAFASAGAVTPEWAKSAVEALTSELWRATTAALANAHVDAGRVEAVANPAVRHIPDYDAGAAAAAAGAAGAAGAAVELTAEQREAATAAAEAEASRIIKRYSRTAAPAAPADVDPIEAAAVVDIYYLLRDTQQAKHANTFIQAACGSIYWRDALRIALTTSAHSFNHVWVNRAEPFANADEDRYVCANVRVPTREIAELPFIFTGNDLAQMRDARDKCDVPHFSGAEEFVDRLRDFVGTYLDDFDLSRSAFTGSAIAAAAIVTNKRNPHGSVQSHFASHYPREYTRVHPRDFRALKALVRATATDLRNRNNPVLRFDNNGDGTGVVVGPQGTSVPFTYVPGADVDIIIDTDSWDEFDAIAIRHYETIRRHYPDAVLTRDYYVAAADDAAAAAAADDAAAAAAADDSAAARYKWRVSGPSMRSVEMYRTPISTFITHHVGMVRGCYTSAIYGGAPQLVVTASFITTMANLSTPNYRYFASRKSTPFSIVKKWVHRGFRVTNLPTTVIQRCLSTAGQFPTLMTVSGEFSPYMSLTELSSDIKAQAAKSGWRWLEMYRD